MATPAIQPVADGKSVLGTLNAILAWARAEASRIGYFAALYRRVTIRLQQELANGGFHNPEFMGSLEVIFANRYFEALTHFRNGQPCSACWNVCFQATAQAKPLIVEQLCVAMNAHINFDLGIATAQTAGPQPLAGFQGDFNHMNDLLVGEVGAVARELAKVSPVIGLLEGLGLHTEEKLVGYSMVEARAIAWQRALKLAVSAGKDQGIIDAMDLEASLAGKLIVDPLLPMSLMLEPIRVRECNDVVQVIDVLAS
jgi:hypothetical protein